MKSLIRCAAVALSLICATSGLAQTSTDAPVAFVAHSDRPMITLEREHGMVRGLVERPLLYVYGDGLVRVERPAYMINPGVFEYRLKADELTELIASLDRDGVMTIDSTTLRAERDAAALAIRSSSGERHFTSDATVTRIKFDFASYARAGATPAPLGNALRYSDLQIDALRYPQLKDLAALANAEKRLLALIDHPSMATSGGADR